MKNCILLLSFLFLCSANAQIRKLKVEPNHSTVGFSISIAGFSKVTGKFTDFEILIDWNEEDIAASTFNAEIKVNSINTGIADRDTHLRSSDFFDEPNYPTITFKSDSIQQVNYSNYKVFGKFSMHGITQDFILPIEIIKIDGNTIGIESKTIINRLDFGVGSDFKHTSMPGFLSDTIDVEISFWTRKRKE